MQLNNALRTYDGAVAIITGGASGIGRALGEELARRGAAVVLADLQIELAQEVAARIQANGGKATAAELDVTQFEAVKSLVESTVKTHGRLDYTFNNAGIGILGEARYYQIADWHRVFDVHIDGVTNGVQAAYPVMVRQGFGHIVNTASMAGLVASPWMVSYSAAKHAIVGLSLALRPEAAAFGVRVSVLCPGVVRTPIIEGGGKFGKLLPPLPPDRQRAFWERIRPMWERMSPMDPDKFARKVLAAVARNQAVVIVPKWWKIYLWSSRLCTSLVDRLTRKSLADLKKALAEVAGEPLEAANISPRLLGFDLDSKPRKR
jgi:NAD(P)-dependent dehydrogenase (short-subunit alcohol dehydrogenase family)